LPFILNKTQRTLFIETNGNGNRNVQTGGTGTGTNCRNVAKIKRKYLASDVYTHYIYGRYVSRELRTSQRKTQKQVCVCECVVLQVNSVGYVLFKVCL